MNNRCILIASVVFSFCCSCVKSSDAGEIIGNEKIPVKVRSALGDPFRTRLATDVELMCSFEPGDEIGVFAAVRTNPSQAATLLSSGNFMDNVKFRYDGNDWEQVDAGDYFYPLDGTGIDIYAYYPYASGVTASSIPYEMSSGKPLVSARTLNATKYDNTALLNFQHKLSLAEVRIDERSTYPNLDVTMLFVLPSGKLDFTRSQYQEFTTTTSTSVDLQINMEMREELPGVFRLYVPPQRFILGNPMFLIETNTRFDLYAPASITFAAGNAYIFKPEMVYSE